MVFPTRQVGTVHHNPVTFPKSSGDSFLSKTKPAKQPIERPIIFSGPMVTAILEGKKTMTRRATAVNLTHDCFASPVTFYDMGENKWACQNCGHGVEQDGGSSFRCPFGAVRDRLWVRETWGWNYGPAGMLSEDCAITYRVDGKQRPFDGNAIVNQTGKFLTGEGKWKSPIFMPRWASRLTLEILSIKVERLQDIGIADIQAEGVLPSDYPNGTYTAEFGWEHRLWREGWDKLNGKRAGSAYAWEKSPWVWVLEFRRVGELKHGT